ncbi:ABC transporter permease [Fodinicola feengrottensis]|uniref:ABC transporter permease n=1 Tax=Fodinicola feengrottensis TaxID=435914 RepID=A0ABN2HDM2_9ACTN|nr:ABC transporter permease [Fodinicola feengrottensis]
MSTATDITLAPSLGATAGPKLDWRRGLIITGGLFLLLCLVRTLTGADDITSGGQISAAITLAIPVGLAGLGGLWAERAGVVNIGLEGMMILGTWSGAYFCLAFNSPWAALVGGVVGGALGGLVHAIATVTFGVDHIISGVAINIIGQGVARYLAVIAFTGKGGGATQSPPVPGFDTIGIPGMTGLLRPIESKHWFLISDLAGLLRGVTTGLSWLTIIAILMVPLTFLVLWRTSFGLRLRSCGENPIAAETLGVNVYRMKYAAVIVSGGMAGMAGAFLVTVASSIYREGQTGGRGYIGLAAMIFGNWRPGGLAAGATLFGFTDALQSRQNSSVHALLFFVALLVVLLSAWNLWRRRWLQGGIGLFIAVLLVVWFFLSTTVPQELITYTPHITTLLVLSLAAQRLRMPAADGVIYRRGQGG